MIITPNTARTLLESIHGINNTLDLIQALQGLNSQLDERALSGLAEAITARNIEALDTDLEELKERFDEYRAGIVHKIDGLNDLCAKVDDLSHDDLKKALKDLQSQFN